VERSDENSAREIVTTRVFDAPPETVFRTWSESALLERWWGPDGFRTVTHSFDFRPGGHWKHTMIGPDGTEYPNHIVYEEITAPARIVYVHLPVADAADAEFRQTVTFAESGPHGDRTELTMRLVFPSAEARNAVVQKYDAIEGAKQTLARLARDLERAASEVPPLHMTRVFDAPKRLVFEAWRRPELLARWFTPAPLTTPRCEVDLRSGGAFRLTMKMPNGPEFPMESRFVEVVEGERIVFTALVHDGLHIHTTVTFEEHDGKTTLDVVQRYSHAADPTKGAKAGWTQSLQQLAEVVAELARP
jgi:uncharacterized protein YndB with AHSA1/START domain